MGNCLVKDLESQPVAAVALPTGFYKVEISNFGKTLISNTNRLGDEIEFLIPKQFPFHKWCSKYNIKSLPKRANAEDVKHDEKYGASDFLKGRINDTELHVDNPTSFSYNTLKAATQKFCDKNLLGEGGSGDVFKGWIDLSTMTAAKPKWGHPVAVKRLKKEGLQGREEWMTEINFLKRLNHPNVVKLIGYCSEDDHSMLVYEYMPKGSLEDILLTGRDNRWSTRLKIAIGSAKGLEYLHGTSSPVIHRDMKSSNILLDNECTPKISDFGLAKLGPQDDKSHTSSRVLGTRGYFAPEYIGTGHLTMKTDVYSFGVVLLEILSGRVAVSRPNSGGDEDLVVWGKRYLKCKPQLHQIIDHKMGRTITRKDASKFAKIIRQCLKQNPKKRPTMTEVVEVLEELERGLIRNCQDTYCNCDCRKNLEHKHSQPSNDRTIQQCCQVQF